MVSLLLCTGHTRGTTVYIPYFLTAVTNRVDERIATVSGPNERSYNTHTTGSCRERVDRRWLPSPIDKCFPRRDDHGQQRENAVGVYSRDGRSGQDAHLGWTP